jgi:hypothetical protein
MSLMLWTKSTAFTEKRSRIEKPIFSEFRDSRVILLLTNHSHDLQRIACMVHSLRPSVNSIGLWEYTDAPVPSALTSLPLKWEKWGDLVAPDAIRPKIEICKGWNRAILNLNNEASRKKVSSLARRIQSFLHNSRILYKDTPRIGVTELKYKLKNFKAHQEELKELQTILWPFFYQLKKALFQQLAHKLFPSQQSALIKHIESKLNENPDRKLYVLVGKIHGDMETTPFPMEVKNLLVSLASKGPFAILDTTRL